MRFQSWVAFFGSSKFNIRRSRIQSQSRYRPIAEQLEGRDLLTVMAYPGAIALGHHGSETPFGGSGPTGYTPAEIRQVYGINQISFNGTAGTGAGTTIAIVDAYNDPSITSDLTAFDTQFGIVAAPSFNVVSQTGSTSLPASNTGWAGEISLDVEWAHAIAPSANILLVEASSSSENDLFTAVKYAASVTGVSVVSMSWGGSEFSGETSYDSTFTTPAGHTPVTFVVSSGDNGAPVSYPSSSPNVLSVGGTTLNPGLAPTSTYSSETGWSGSGGGVSSYEKDSYQTGTSSARSNPDVSYDADPNSGFSVYETYGNSASTPWLVYGGTSDAAPQWAAMIAIADQGRATAGETALSSATLLPMIYQLPASDFHDITSGTSTGSPHYTAGVGYDLVTGRGTPIANSLVAGLVGSPPVSPPPSPPTTPVTHLSVSAPSTSTAGASFSVTVTALAATGTSPVSTYTGTVQFSSTDGLASLPASYTFTSADAGVHTFTVTLKTAGTESITATDKATSTISGTTSVTVNPGVPTQMIYLQQPTNVAIGAAISPAVKVELEDQYGNVVTTDNTDQVSLKFGTNPSSATLTGGGPVTVANGVATFSSVTVNAAGTGYTLVASSGALPTATSTAFNATSPPASPPPSPPTAGTIIEPFNSGLGQYYYTGPSYPAVKTSAAAAHDGPYGLDDSGDGNWYLRLDSAGKLNPGDSFTVWVDFSGNADGRAYFGFGTTAYGTLSVVLAPNSNQMIIQSSPGFGTFNNLATVNQTFAANTWYHVEVDWGSTGKVVAKLFSSNGQTLLNSLSAATGDTTSGDFAFRAIGSDKYFDTVAVVRGGSPNAILASGGLAPAALTNSMVTSPALPIASHSVSEPMVIVAASRKTEAAVSHGFFEQESFLAEGAWFPEVG